MIWVKKKRFAQKVAKEDIWGSTNFSKSSFTTYVRKIKQEIYHDQFDASFKYDKSWPKA
jgi:hypothetical protein